MFRKLIASCAVTAAIGLPQLAVAALPQSQAPSRGEGSNILQTIQNWGFDGFMLIGLIILGVMFLGVAWHAFGVYTRSTTARKNGETWAPPRRSGWASWLWGFSS